MCEAKTFLETNKARFFDDATADAAWNDAAAMGKRASASQIVFGDNSLLVRDPLACTVTAVEASAAAEKPKAKRSMFSFWK